MRVLSDLILSYPKTYLISFFLLTIAAIWPALQIQTEFSLEGFFPLDDRNILEYQEMSEEFGRDDNIIVLAIQHEQLFHIETLDRISQLTSELTTISHITEVQSLITVEQIRNEDGQLLVEPYLKNWQNNSINLDSVQVAMREDPFLSGILLSPDGKTTLITLHIAEDKNIFEEREIIISELYEILNGYKDLEIRVTGIPYFRNQYVHLLNGEIIYYVSVASVLIIALLWYLFRSILGVLIPISIVWLTILFTTAVISVSGGVFEVLSSTIAPILLCVGIADSVHMLTKYNDTRQRGLRNRASLKETIIVLGSATLLTSITTAIGFGTLITSNVIPMQRFGLYTAVGVILAFFITIFLLPSLLMLINPRKNTGKITSGAFRYIGYSLKKTHILVRAWHKPIVIFVFVSSALIGLGVTQLRVNSFVFDEVGQNSPLIVNSRFVDTYIGPQFPFEIVVDTGEDAGVLSPEIIQKVDSLQQFLATFPEIHKSISFTDVIREIHSVMEPETKAGALPDSRELIAQYQLLFELTGNERLDRFIDFSQQKTRIAVLSEDVGSYRMNQIRKELTQFTENLFQDTRVVITGTTMLVASLTANIVTSLAYSIILAFLFISVIMAILFRNKKLVLISLLPNVIPLLLTAGVMGFLGIDIKPSTAVIFTIAFGIAVDDSIHFLARFRIETLRGKSLDEAVRITTEKTGRAIILTSAILLVGFGVLGTSSFESTQYMGLLTCLTIFNAIIADLVFLPALIYWLRPELDSHAKAHRNQQISSAKRTIQHEA